MALLSQHTHTHAHCLATRSEQRVAASLRETERTNRAGVDECPGATRVSTPLETCSRMLNIRGMVGDAPGANSLGNPRGVGESRRGAEPGADLGVMRGRSCVGLGLIWGRSGAYRGQYKDLSPQGNARAPKEDQASNGQGSRTWRPMPRRDRRVPQRRPAPKSPAIQAAPGGRSRPPCLFLGPPFQLRSPAKSDAVGFCAKAIRGLATRAEQDGRAYRLTQPPREWSIRCALAQRPTNVASDTACSSAPMLRLSTPAGNARAATVGSAPL